MCTYHQTSADSHFTQKKVISLSTSTGRITLNNRSLKITRDGETKETLFDESQFETYLKQHFDIELKIGT